MASTARGFRAHEPTLISYRSILPVELLSLDGMADELRNQLAINAPRCDVDVLAWAFQAEHLHLVLRQPFDHSPSNARRGIGALLRNVSSALTRLGNARTDSVGHFFNNVYHSHPLRSVQAVLELLDRLHGRPRTFFPEIPGFAYGWDGLARPVATTEASLGEVDFARHSERFRSLLELVVRCATEAEREAEAAAPLPAIGRSKRKPRRGRRPPSKAGIAALLSASLQARRAALDEPGAEATIHRLAPRSEEEGGPPPAPESQTRRTTATRAGTTRRSKPLADLHAQPRKLHRSPPDGGPPPPTAG